MEAPADAVAVRHLPDPGESIPAVAWPTVALFAAAVVVFGASTALAVGGSLPMAIAIALNAIASYMFFTVLHDACHRSISQDDRVNTWLGRLSGPFLAPPISSYSVFRWIHMQHHRFTNHDTDRDPDAYTENGPGWQLPLRWATIDFYYARFYLRAWRTRPRRELVELAVTAATIVGVGVACAATGHLLDFVLLYLLPARLALIFLAFAFDWLPHHGLDARPEEDRFRTTRNRVGWERLMAPVFLYQNYHLVHHLHPLIPFYRYISAWRRNEDAYLAHEPSLSTVSGRELSVEDYRRLRPASEREN
jgi:fatty acid desaturase